MGNLLQATGHPARGLGLKPQPFATEAHHHFRKLPILTAKFGHPFGTNKQLRRSPHMIM
jgi:hypothetical protein